ncbi:hypothetical protein EW145_g2386 [Phellinidium pouzarii]|uniref:NADAR domain-containing protein n=1 Tax=Phellinidium pouzarii TaxID=167371 RepID=A0A4S4LD02_9AGAM|nr:hypothetical protein EW145_g2386 [Phellinidium pouzarii]
MSSSPAFDAKRTRPLSTQIPTPTDNHDVVWQRPNSAPNSQTHFKVEERGNSLFVTTSVSAGEHWDDNEKRVQITRELSDVSLGVEVEVSVYDTSSRRVHSCCSESNARADHVNDEPQATGTGLRSISSSPFTSSGNTGALTSFDPGRVSPVFPTSSRAISTALGLRSLSPNPFTSSKQTGSSTQHDSMKESPVISSFPHKLKKTSPFRSTFVKPRIYFYDIGAPYYGFTNFSSHPVEFKGKTYPTSEHLFQSFKFQQHRPLLAEHIRTFSERPAVALSEARRFQPEVRSDWMDVNVEMMEVALWHKFNQHSDLKQQLLSTGVAELIEDSDKDSFWGIGKNRNGRNELGKALERLRATFRADII